MQLPEEFVRTTETLMGRDRFEQYLHSFEEDAPVSIRLNPAKMEEGRWTMDDAEPVPWCRHAYYLKRRPNFTFDPLFHAGCYYVQEAASMFLDEVLKQTPPDLPEGEEGLRASESVRSSSPSGRLGGVLDLCAAPGGKSTLLRSALPEDCVLYSNEPMQKRASILLENVTKWGYKNHYVTNLYPKDYRKSKMKFDLILCDVPCSGEGMFRKDPATIGEWSSQNVEKCWQLQREIVSDAWACLNDGGILIYCTCTFNTKENEENIRWILSEFDAEVLSIQTKPEWHITGSLLEDFNEPVYRFIPGITRSEGLFMCVLRKGGNSKTDTGRGKTGTLKTMTSDVSLQPSAVKVELTYAQAMAYLRREALVLPPDTPRGIVDVCFMGHPLGQMKNIGPRANNLYPKEWRIKTTHVPQEYDPVLW